MNSAPLSVVVIGRNEGVRLGRCLRSVRDMARLNGDVELVYVDSDSTDGSVATAESFGAQIVKLKPGRCTAGLARNEGWRHSRGELILFLDGDTVLHPSFVADSLNEFRSERVAVVWGHRREIDTPASLYNRVLDLDWIYPPGLTEFCGGDALMRRTVLQEMGGFDEGLIAGEEPELCRRIRARDYQILHVDRPMTSHDLNITRFSQYWRRALRAGYAYAEISSRFQSTRLPFWQVEARANRRHAAILCAAPVPALTSAILSKSIHPFLGALVFGGLLMFRTAIRSRWKSSNWFTVFLYALHSQFQQIPVFCGQLRFVRDQRTGVKRNFISYKEVTP